MNPITQHLYPFLRRIRLAIGRLHVPHCEDCKNLTDKNSCLRFGINTPGWKKPVRFWPADWCRGASAHCGKHGRYFEPKEGE